MPDFVQLLCRLVDGKVDFVLVGGLAAATHGCTLVTQDIDLCVNLALPNLERLQRALADLHPVHRLTPRKIPFHHEATVLAELKNIYLQTDWGQLDCLGDVKGLGDYRRVLTQSQTFDLNGRPCRILTLQALITAKQAMNRPRDIETIRQLTVILELKKSAKTRKVIHPKTKS
ncbi:MAG TPA: nucleotidyltransferase [Candidatus Paceibacterota bacterium]|nr:nucleotidyltransferase [Verrucomicrobiota bacterium]HRY51926.1 nucleotidyltransferase [Candidatus Paceibacterota bacterium]HRZ99782.1 nucleotidyltransferase [Candidatus Paceibacterota bacterium]